MLLVLGLAYVALERLVRSPWGRVLRAIREDEMAASLPRQARLRFRLQAFVIGCAIWASAARSTRISSASSRRENYLPILTFQVWAMLIVGGAGNNRGAILGAFVVWALWTLSGGLLREIVPVQHQARAASLQVMLIGLLLAAILLARPRGLLGEEIVVSRHAGAESS